MLCWANRIEDKGWADLLSRYLPVSASLIVLTLSILVMAGWSIQSPVLVQVCPGFFAMQFNTALSFSIASAMLLLLIMGRFGWASYVSSLGLVFSGLVFLQYILEIDLGIDTLFVQPKIAVESYPGRMGFNTALCFVIFYISVLWRSLTRLRYGREPSAAAVVIALGLLSFIGYLSDTSNLYGWGEGLSGMSVHTSVGFMLLGAAWLVMIRTRICRDQHGLLTPLSVGLAIMIATMVSSSTLYRIEQDRRRLVIARDMQQITDLVQYDFQQRSRAVDYASRGWEQLRDNEIQERWEWVIGDLLEDDVDILSVLLLDAQGHVLLRDGDSDTLTHDFAPGELVGESWTALIPGSGGRYVSVVPLSEESPGGAMVFVTDVRRVFDRHRERLAPLFDARLVSKEQYSEVQWKAQSQGTAHAPVSFRGIEWEILLVANRAFYEHYTDAWPEASLIIGVLFAIMIGGLLRTIELKRSSMQKQHELLNELSYQKAAIDQHAIVAVTDPRGRITYANEQFCEISGYSLEELIGQTHSIVNSGHHPKAFFTDLWRVISSGRTWHGNICNRRKDGGLYWVSTTIVPFKSVSGKILRYISVRSDITKIVEHDSKLESLNTELARSNEEMAHFTHTVSHDLKSPLISIRGFLARVRNELADGKTTNAIGMLDRIDSIAGGMYETISDLLSLCRIGREVSEPGACDLRAVVHHVLSQHRGQIEEQGALVTVGESMPWVWGDQVLVTQVMQNLITNALKYGHKPGEMSVVRINADQQGDEVLIAVEDDGPGIDPKDQDRVFELFHRLERGCEGTGVGLAIVKRIVELQGGRVWIESDLGAGTRFCVAWPIAESAALAA